MYLFNDMYPKNYICSVLSDSILFLSQLTVTVILLGYVGPGFLQNPPRSNAQREDFDHMFGIILSLLSTLYSLRTAYMDYTCKINSDIPFIVAVFMYVLSLFTNVNVGMALCNMSLDECFKISNVMLLMYTALMAPIAYVVVYAVASSCAFNPMEFSHKEFTTPTTTGVGPTGVCPTGVQLATPTIIPTVNHPIMSHQD